MKQAAQQAAADAQKRAQLAELAKRVPELEKLVPTANSDRDAYKLHVEDMRARAKGKAKTGLVHDLARFVLAVNPVGAEQATQQAKLLATYSTEHGDIRAAGTADPIAVASLPEYERGLEVLTNKAANLQRDLDAARAAKAQFDELAPNEDAVDVSAEIAEIEQLLADARAGATRAMNAALDIEAVLKKRTEADDKTKTAAQHHAAVMAWLAIADQLAPSGIPAQLLKEALEPVNAALHQAALDSEWPRVEIHEDMSITIEKDAGRPRIYQLESESYRWRADAHIAQVVATMSKLKVLVLDSVDVLQPSARPQLFSWLDLLVAEGDIDSVVLCAALQRPPESLLDTFQSVWMDAGNVVQHKERAAA